MGCVMSLSTDVYPARQSGDNRTGVMCNCKKDGEWACCYAVQGCMSTATDETKKGAENKARDKATDKAYKAGYLC